MNNSSVNIIKRQLLIIQFLLESNYVSTEDIQKYLKANSFDVPIRNIQRDLAVLEEIIPLECKKDDKPYSWRWKRLPDVQNHDLTITQAVVLRMVETELKDVIPRQLYEDLYPLFLKARYIKGLTQLSISNQQGMASSPNSNVINMPITFKLLVKLKSLKNRSRKTNQTPKRPLSSQHYPEDSLVLNQLIHELNHHELDFLVELLIND